jgi:hypothetical protein
MARIREYCGHYSLFQVVFIGRIFKTNLDKDCQALSWTMTGVWESLSLRIDYAKAVLVGVPAATVSSSSCVVTNRDFTIHPRVLS